MVKYYENLLEAAEEQPEQEEENVVERAEVQQDEENLVHLAEEQQEQEQGTIL